VPIETLRLAGSVTEVSRRGLYLDERERITVAVEGAEPLYAEIRIPNTQGWVLGQKLVLIMAVNAASYAREIAA
jgi:hypothetical protein